MKKLSQSGFSVVELGIVVIVLAILGGAGYYVWQKNGQKNQSMTTASSTSSYHSSSTTAPTAPQVNSASDLNNAMHTLNQTDVAAGSSDSSQLSTEASGF